MGCTTMEGCSYSLNDVRLKWVIEYGEEQLVYEGVGVMMYEECG